MTKRSIKVRLEDGLDARPVALLVQEASKYESNIYIEVDDKRINGTDEDHPPFLLNRYILQADLIVHVSQ